MKLNIILEGDVLKRLNDLPDESVDMCMTSPPYWALRDYGVEGQLGLESTFEEYINKLCNIFDEIKRVLKKDCTCWVNMGDTYANDTSTGTMVMGNPHFNKNRPCRQNTKIPSRKVNLPNKSLCMIPERFAIEMINRGWILRNTIIWHKPNVMPSSASDRFTVDFEKIFFFTKSKKYYFEQQLEPYTKPMNCLGGDKLKADGESSWDYGTGQETYRERSMRPNSKGRNKRCVWEINTKPFKDAHFAVFPEELCETPIKAGCPENGIVLDPFFGSGTLGVVVLKNNRKFIGIELNPEYIEIANKRLRPYLEQRIL